MNARTALDFLLDALSEERLQEVIWFARILVIEDERDEWQAFGQAQITRAYGPDEPEYSAVDIRRRGVR
jgi:hypothetical protein